MKKKSVALDRASPSFIADLKKALGLHDGEVLTITTPQFERTDGRVVNYRPATVEEFDALKLMHPTHLKDIGCQIWEEASGKVHWLYPYEWYSFIPDGYPVTFIDGSNEPFKPGVTDDDTRFGALAYGFIQEVH